MKKQKSIICMLMSLVMLLSLCACGKEPAEEVSGPTRAAVQETEPGYILTELPGPAALEYVSCWDTCGDTVWMGGERGDGALLLQSYDTMNEQWQCFALDTGEARYPYLEAFSVAGDTVWALLGESCSEEQIISGSIPGDLGYYVLHLDPATGNTGSIRIPFSGESGTESSSLTFTNLLALDAERALLCTYESVYLIDPEVNVLQRPELTVYGAGFHFRVNDKLYLRTEEGYAPLDIQTLCYGEAIAEELNGEYGSSLGHFLTQEQGALCQYDPASGETMELFRWMDVALSYSSMSSYWGFENARGDFFYPAGNDLIKVTKGMVPVKQTLTIGCFGDAGDAMYQYQPASYSYTNELMDAIIRFNNTDPEFKIQVKPLVYSSEAERDRLLIELATGSEIDVLDTSLLPDGALDAGLLVDMLPYIDADADIHREDFIQPLFYAMLKDGGLYEYTDKFTMLTMTTHPSLFPGREDWTVETIEGLLARYPDMTLPNDMDREQLLTLFSWAATAEFIDWENMTCSFDCAAFQNWLRFIKERPEGGGENLLVVDYNLTSNAGYWTRLILNDDYIIAGFPDTKGTGSYFLKLGNSPNEMVPIGENTRLGVMASSEHPDAAWRFVKTLMLGEKETNLYAGIPVFKDRFEKTVEASITEKTGLRDGFAYFSADDAQRLREQVYGTTKTVHTDETLLSVIRTEAEAYFSGQKSAEEAASQIQSRLSLYLAERK